MLNMFNNLVIILLCIVCMTCSLGNDDEIITYHTIVNGTIIDKETKLPIEDVKVDLDLTFSLFYSRFKGRTYTNSAGEFRFEDYYTPGEKEFFASYNLDIDKKGYNGKSDYKEGIIKGEENNITIELTPWTIEFHTVAKGHFLELDTENPIEGVKVSLLRDIYAVTKWDTVNVNQTDSAGYFYLDDYYTRETNDWYPQYTLEFHKDGYDHPKFLLTIDADSAVVFKLHLSPL